MNLCYITALRYPSMQANRAQVAKMSEAFSRYTDFKLIVAARSPKRDDVFSEYGIRSRFIVAELGDSPRFIWPRALWYALHIAHKIKTEESADVVFYTRDILLTCMLACISKRFRKRFFFELHSLGRFPSIMYRLIFRCAKGIVSTNALKKQAVIMRWRVDEKKILVAPNGVDVELFSARRDKNQARANLGFLADQRIVMYVGSAQYWKGVSVISECAKALPEFLFVIVGAEVTGGSNLRALPRVPQHEVPQYLHAADLLIAPYPKHYALSSKWSSPLKVAEYMASGTPMIVSDLPIMQDFVDSTTALLVDPPTAVGFIQAIRWAFSHYADMEKRAERARAHSKNFTWEKRARSIIQFMQSRLI